MIRFFRAVLILWVWSFCAGIHWDVLQLGAWARVYLKHADRISVVEAANVTFGEREMCGVYNFASDREESGQPGTLGLLERIEKPVLWAGDSQRLPARTGACRLAEWPAALRGLRGLEGWRPLLPPPRSYAG